MAYIKIIPGQDLAKVINALSPGDHVVELPVGESFASSFIILPEGVKLTGPGKEKATLKTAFGIGLSSRKVVKEKAIDLRWEGQQYIYDLKEAVEGKNEISGFTLDGMQRKCRIGIQTLNRSRLKFIDLAFKDCEEQGLHIKAEGRAILNDIYLQNIATFETASESSNLSWGHITFTGAMEDVKILNCKAVNKVRGYPMKFTTGFDDWLDMQNYIRNVVIDGFENDGKPMALWNGSKSANFAIEFWKICAEGIDIRNGKFSNGLSCEFNNPLVRHKFSYWIHDNYIKVPIAAIGEIACSNILFQKNKVDYTANEGPFTALGEFNSGVNKKNGMQSIDNVQIIGNTFDLIEKNIEVSKDKIYKPLRTLTTFTSKVTNLLIADNIFNNPPEEITFVELRRQFSNGSEGFTFSNNVGKKFKEFAFTEGNNGQYPKNVVSNNNGPNAKPGSSIIQVPTPIDTPVITKPVPIQTMNSIPSTAIFLKGVNFSGTDKIVNGNLYSGNTQGWAIGGTKFNYTAAGVPDLAKVGYWGNPIEIFATGLKPGKYWPVITTGEDNSPQTITILANGVKLIEGKRMEAGKIEAVTAEVTVKDDGKLQILGFGGDVNIYAIALYQVPEEKEKTIEIDLAPFGHPSWFTKVPAYRK